MLQASLVLGACSSALPHGDGHVYRIKNQCGTAIAVQVVYDDGGPEDPIDEIAAGSETRIGVLLGHPSEAVLRVRSTGDSGVGTTITPDDWELVLEGNACP